MGSFPYRFFYSVDGKRVLDASVIALAEAKLTVDLPRFELLVCFGSPSIGSSVRAVCGMARVLDRFAHYGQGFRRVVGGYSSMSKQIGLMRPLVGLEEYVLGELVESISALRTWREVKVSFVCVDGLYYVEDIASTFDWNFVESDMEVLMSRVDLSTVIFAAGGLGDVLSHRYIGVVVNPRKLRFV